MGVLLKVLTQVTVVWSVFSIVSDAQSTVFTEYSPSSLSCSTPCAVSILSVIGDLKSENEQLKREVADHYEETKQNKRAIEDLKQQVQKGEYTETPLSTTKATESTITTESTSKHTTLWTETTTQSTTVSVPVSHAYYCTSSCNALYGPTVVAECVNGYCECDGTDYNKYTCHTEVGSCMIRRNQKDALARPLVDLVGTFHVYSCTSKPRGQYEVHIIGNNRNDHSDATLPLKLVKYGIVTKKIVIVLSSREKVSWELEVPSGVELHKVELYSYNLDYCSVKFSNGTDLPLGVLERKGRDTIYEDDRSGTLGRFLRKIESDFGGITSFTARFEAYQWTLKIGDPTVPAEVPFGQKKFLSSSTFHVPEGVTHVDVICIGGGGGGKDRYSTRNGGQGGNSSFGEYLHAEGGLNGTSAGAQGGWGFTAFGGYGGWGGDCSAGAGAAGETIHGDGRLIPGSSEFPFCGGGGSSDCTHNNITAATSGPGGERPVGRHGGKYGGGGGSKGGGRAGGGGGYSRSVVPVTAGEEIQIIVGTAGSPYSEGRPADGIVVVSWGGNIDPSKPFQ